MLLNVLVDFRNRSAIRLRQMFDHKLVRFSDGTSREFWIKNLVSGWSEIEHVRNCQLVDHVFFIVNPRKSVSIQLLNVFFVANSSLVLLNTVGSSQQVDRDGIVI